MLVRHLNGDVYQTVRVWSWNSAETIRLRDLRSLKKKAMRD